MKTASTRTILLVDDDPSVLTVTLRILQSDGHTVYTAANGLEALEFTARFAGQLDLLITDYNMPGMDGIALIERVCEKHPNIKLLLISGRGSPKIAECKHKPNFLCKPFLPSTLLEKVQTLCNE